LVRREFRVPLVLLVPRVLRVLKASKVHLVSQEFRDHREAQGSQDQLVLRVLLDHKDQLVPKVIKGLKVVPVLLVRRVIRDHLALPAQ
jgi:hypothetical protein